MIERHPHLVSRTTYLVIFLVLMALLAATLAAADHNLGQWNFLVAMFIATVKALLIVLYFMHLRWSTQLTRVFAGAGFAWLALLIGLTLADVVNRHPGALGR